MRDPKKGLINRKTYKEIKAKDHQQMEAYLQALYKEAYADGFEAGKAASQGLRADELREILQTTKGIGERRTEAVMQRVREAQEKGDSHGKSNADYV